MSHSASKKTTKIYQKFLPIYTKEYPCVVASKKSEFHGRFTVCALDFSVSHGGIGDVRKHVGCAAHRMCKQQNPSPAHPN